MIRRLKNWYSAIKEMGRVRSTHYVRTFASPRCVCVCVCVSVWIRVVGFFEFVDEPSGSMEYGNVLIKRASRTFHLTEPNFPAI
jgi:hypothetical protein